MPQAQDSLSVVRAALRGERDALRHVWEDNRRWVAAILLAHKPRGVDLDDLLQEVAQALVTKSSQVREPEALRPWLRTVAINTARLAARKRNRHADENPGVSLRLSGGALDVASPAPSEAPIEAIERRDEADRLLSLARRLPDGYREPLLMRCLHDMSYRQIGEVMGLPDTTIETRIARGRRMLREMAQYQEHAARQRSTEDAKGERTTRETRTEP
ncbi:MAG: sigma-70 family RNA polymerase sigma factor [Phycisphaerales bacterium]|jgi:RNA polymerase sigma-70 factor (ECF subfamily)|nr:sigma-70 family RNA polymerase sigma factor [Phycisphaerales bacterium]